jgi:hypothetical protein
LVLSADSDFGLITGAQEENRTGAVPVMNLLTEGSAEGEEVRERSYTKKALADREPD